MAKPRRGRKPRPLRRIAGRTQAQVGGGPITPRAVGGPVRASAVGGPITPRAVGGPIAPRWVTGGPMGERAAKRAVAASADGTPTVIYIHGIGNKPAPAVLKRQCDQALFRIDMGARTRLAYWADIRYPQPLPGGEIEGQAIPTPDSYRSPGGADRRLSPERARDLAPYGRDAERYAAALAAKLFADRTEHGRPRTSGVEEKLLPGFIRRPVVEWITKTFIQDTAAYFFDPTQRDEMRRRFREVLLGQAGPCLVVAHSQGTIIAYDVLRELDADSQGVRVPLFVTIGSPLGLDEVQDHLRKPLRIPKVVTRWRNFADLADPVALDKTLADEFTGGGNLEDVTVVNRDTLWISGFNPHSGVGYLSTEPVRAVVREEVGTSFVSPVAPFVIARDVAAEMADPTARLPVLIELKEEGGGTLAERALALEKELRQLEQAFKDALPADHRNVDYFKIDRLRRYVAADLTASEIDSLAARHHDLQFVSVWKNSGKRALLNRSTEVVQAHTAHLGYGAMGKGIIWAILDTGVAADHPHFATHRNIAAQWDCTHPGGISDGPVGDRDGHGTHVAGIIAGVGVQKHEGLESMAPQAKLHIYKVLADDGTGKDSWIIKALDHIATVNESASELVIHGVNLSLGGPFDEAVYACGFSPICRELRRLWRQGVVVCIAAGNEGRLIIDTAEGEQKLNLDLSIGDPANLDEAIAVGSVHKESPHLYGISWFSSRGPTADGRAKPDVVAPGERILSCNAAFRGRGQDTEYVALSGTSMACPHISGMIAAFLSARREFIGSPERVKEILMKNCTDLGRDRYHQGAGVPNLVRMLMGT